jgi:nascent polypeptide-associated complex subunit alpha
MFPNLDPKKMQAVMKQMGINQQEVDASRVIIEKTDGNKVIINNPSVVKIKMQGQESFQITGDVSESEGEKNSFSEEDIEILMQKTSCSREEAENALQETQDLADAIMKLS